MLVTGPQLSSKFVLASADGFRAVFNDPTDPDYVGVVTEVTGLDSPDVRESADDLIQMDGGVHGNFYYGRRPVTISGMVLNPTSASDRNSRMTKLRAASNAMRSDATLTWQVDEPTGGTNTQFISVRRQQPLRIGGAWQKDFQLSLVAADPCIYGATLYNLSVTSLGAAAAGRAYPHGFPTNYGGGAISGQLLVENRGNACSYPLLTLAGPGTNPVVYNLTTGGVIPINYTLSTGDSMLVDTRNRTIVLNGTTSRYGSLDFLNTVWFGLNPGINDIRIAWASFSGSAGLTVQYRDAWI